MAGRSGTFRRWAPDPVIRPEARPLTLKVALPFDPRGEDPLPAAAPSLAGTGSGEYQERPHVRGRRGPSP